LGIPFIEFDFFIFIGASLAISPYYHMLQWVHEIGRKQETAAHVRGNGNIPGRR
jgi:hypothetical protein